MAGLTQSDATWKVVVSSVPISIPTGSDAGGRDGWADFEQEGGFERELRGLLASLRDASVRNLVWITTDVHFASAFRYTPFPESPEFVFHEVVTGPLHAGLFPHRRFDTSLGTERLFYYGAESPAAVTRYEDARRWFNYGVLEIDGGGALTLRIVDVEGETLWEHRP